MLDMRLLESFCVLPKMLHFACLNVVCSMERMFILLFPNCNRIFKPPVVTVKWFNHKDILFGIPGSVQGHQTSPSPCLCLFEYVLATRRIAKKRKSEACFLDSVLLEEGEGAREGSNCLSTDTMLERLNMCKMELNSY